MKKSRNRGIKRVQTALLCLTIVLAAACGGPSEEKVKEVQSAYAELVNRHNEVIEAYADLKDDSLSQELDEMAEKINTIGQQDTDGMTEEELDDVIADLKDNIASYDDILASIGKIKEQENTDEETSAVPLTIRNETGVPLYQLYLYPASDKDQGDNLVEKIGYLDGNQTYNLVNLYLAEDEMLWHLEAIDEEGNIIESADVDFAGCGEDGAVIILKYSFDTMKGWIEME